MKIDITVEEAQSILDNRCNGVLEGVHADKGGRAWLDGEWQLCELEALCVVIRACAGEGADGAEDLIARWKQMDLDNERG